MYLDQLMSKVNIYNLDNIKFFGEFKDIRKPYSSIDCLIVPSLWYETGGPLVVREALIAKIPVIASRIGSIPELIKDNVNGMLFEPGNPKDLADKMIKIINDPHILKKFQKRIRPPKSLEEHATEIEKIYKMLIK